MLITCYKPLLNNTGHQQQQPPPPYGSSNKTMMMVKRRQWRLLTMGIRGRGGRRGIVGESKEPSEWGFYRKSMMLWTFRNLQIFIQIENSVGTKVQKNASSFVLIEFDSSVRCSGLITSLSILNCLCCCPSTLVFTCARGHPCKFSSEIPAPNVTNQQAESSPR